ALVPGGTPKCYRARPSQPDVTSIFTKMYTAPRPRRHASLARDGSRRAGAMDGEALLRKLQVKPGARMTLIGAPAAIEAPLGGVLTLVEPGQACDAALAFCNNPAEVAAFAPQ